MLLYHSKKKKNVVGRFSVFWMVDVSQIGRAIIAEVKSEKKKKSSRYSFIGYMQSQKILCERNSG